MLPTPAAGGMLLLLVLLPGLPPKQRTSTQGKVSICNLNMYVHEEGGKESLWPLEFIRMQDGGERKREATRMLETVLPST